VRLRKPPLPALFWQLLHRRSPRGPGTDKHPMTVAVGDKVIIGKYSGTQIKVDGQEYTISEVKDILAVVE
jgi:co-chaperonin GroES (HSP10)